MCDSDEGSCCICERGVGYIQKRRQRYDVYDSVG